MLIRSEASTVSVFTLKMPQIGPAKTPESDLQRRLASDLLGLRAVGILRGRAFTQGAQRLRCSLCHATSTSFRAGPSVWPSCPRCPDRGPRLVVRRGGLYVTRTA